MPIIAVLVLGAFAFYVLNPDERARLLRPVLAVRRPTQRALARGLAGSRWLLVGMVSGNPWAVTIAVTTAILILHPPAQGVDWRSLADLKPEIEKLIATEITTARAYDAAVAQFQLGALSAEGLADTIKMTLMPELQAITLRLPSPNEIRDEHRPLLAQIEEYLQLRNESWRLRAEALERHSMTALKLAERVERVSLDLFDRVRHVDPK